MIPTPREQDGRASPTLRDSQTLSRFLSKVCRLRAGSCGVRLGGGGEVLLLVAGAVGAAAEHEVGAVLQEPVEDGLGEIRICEHIMLPLS